MNTSTGSSLHRLAVIAGMVLLAPAVVLVTSGLLFRGFGLESANTWLDRVMTHTAGRLFFSPVSVLGGLVVAMALNLISILRLWPSWDEDYFAITFSFRKAWGRLLQVALALALLACLLIYAFVENFRVVPR